MSKLPYIGEVRSGPTPSGQSVPGFRHPRSDTERAGCSPRRMSSAAWARRPSLSASRLVAGVTPNRTSALPRDPLLHEPEVVRRIAKPGVERGHAVVVALDQQVGLLAALGNQAGFQLVDQAVAQRTPARSRRHREPVDPAAPAVEAAQRRGDHMATFLATGRTENIGRPL